MTVSQVSIDAYREAMRDGTIPKARAKALTAILAASNNGEKGFTQLEICEACGTRPSDFSRIAPRVRELEASGVIEKTGEVITDPVTNKGRALYRVTGNPYNADGIGPPRLPSRRRVIDYINAIETPEEFEALLRETRYAIEEVA